MEDESLLEDPLCSGERQPPEGREDDTSGITANNNNNGMTRQVKNNVPKTKQQTSHQTVIQVKGR